MSKNNNRCLEEGGLNCCYADESGTGSEPVATMVGIIADSGRMHVTKSEWNELLKILSQMTKQTIVELHTADFYNGNGVWRVLDGPLRSRVTTAIFNWISERKHHIVYASVLKASYYGALKTHDIPDELNTLWRFLGFHLTLAIQRYSQPEKKNKGHTFLFFDNEERERVRFADLVNRPPPWSDEYYARGKKQEQLDQIIDVPYFGDSQEVSLLQVADFLAFFLRRYIEIQEGLVPPRYEDEEEKHLRNGTIGNFRK